VTEQGLSPGLGVVTIVVAATGAFLELQAALNTIWRVQSTRVATLKGFLTDRLRSFGVVVAIGFLLLVSLPVTALDAFSGWLARRSSAMRVVWNGVAALVSLTVRFETVLVAVGLYHSDLAPPIARGLGWVASDAPVAVLSSA
jgi:membrane protein